MPKYDLSGKGKGFDRMFDHKWAALEVVVSQQISSISRQNLITTLVWQPGSHVDFQKWLIRVDQQNWNGFN